MPTGHILVRWGHGWLRCCPVWMSLNQCMETWTLSMHWQIFTLWDSQLANIPCIPEYSLINLVYVCCVPVLYKLLSLTPLPFPCSLPLSCFSSTTPLPPPPPPPLSVILSLPPSQSFQKELGSHQKSIDSANASGQHLVSEILDDPTVTQHDMQEMNGLWENVCQRSVQKQERLDAALEVCTCTCACTCKSNTTCVCIMYMYLCACTSSVRRMYCTSCTYFYVRTYGNYWAT